MENTTPGPLKNNLTSTPCMKRRSLFTAPDVSPIRNGTNSKRNSATNIVSKIPVKLPTKIPLLRRQTKTSEPEKPVLKTKLNNDQTDASGKIKNEKENRSPKLPAAGKEAANKSSNSSTSNKKNTAENVSKMEWDTLEVLSVQVLPPVSKEKSNLEIDLDDDDDGDFQFSKKGKKNISNKKSPSTKKAKGADKKPAKSARGKKKETAEETEATPEETKINSKIQLDGDGANKVAESRRVLKKGPNKDQKKPAARNKRKAADSNLDPVEELNDAEDEKRASTRNKRKTLGGDLETIAEEAIHAEVSKLFVADQTKSPTKNRRRTFDLGPIAEEPKTVEDEVKSPPRNKRETADSDVTPVTEEPKNDDDKKPAKSTRGKKKETAEEAEAAPEDTPEDQKKPAARNKRKAADSKLDPVEELNDVEDQTKSPTKNRRRTFELGPIAKEPKKVEDEVKSPPRNKRKTADSDVTTVTEEPKNVDAAQTTKTVKAEKMGTDQEDGDRQLPVEASKEESEEASNVDDKALKESESEVAPKRKRKKKNEEDVKEVSAAFSEIGEKGQENSDAKEPEAEPKNEIEPEVVPKRKRKQKNEVDVKEVSAAFSEIGEKESKPKVVPKNKRKKKNEEDVKEISAAFSEMGEKEEENVEAKEPEAEPKTGTEVEPRRRTRKVAQKTVQKIVVRESSESTKSETVTETSKGSEKKSDQQNASKKQEMMSKPSTSKLKLPADMPAPSSSLTVRSSNTSGVEKQILMNSIFGSPANTNSKPSKPVEVFRSLKPSDNVMGGFISMIPSSIHSGLATNYNMYFLSTDTLLKVNTCGMERVIGKHTSFIIPKESRFCFENVGEETAILSFTKLRSI